VDAETFVVVKRFERKGEVEEEEESCVSGDKAAQKLMKS